MNTKKKHKNRPKPNPQSAKVETEGGDEKVANVTKSEEKFENLVKSEVMEISKVLDVVEVTSPEVESADAEIESPKKPKRKGNKKNQDKGNEETPPAMPLADQQSEVVEKISEDATDESKPETCVTTSARKKKNKKKSHETVCEHPNIPEKESSIVEEKPNTDISLEKLELSDKTEDVKLETKTKKKNKKKKRNDSEKSDKSEEISCTSAFQKLITENTPENVNIPAEKEPSQKEGQIAPHETQSQIPIGMQMGMVSEDPAIILEIESIEKIKECKQTSENQEEPMGKKKNKKDKKQSKDMMLKTEKPMDVSNVIQNKSLMELIDPFLSQSSIQNKESSPSPILEAVPEAQPHILKDTTQIERAASPKPKAKIAKPVEKKRKSNQDEPEETINKSTENLLTEPIIQQEIIEIPKKIEESVKELQKETESHSVLSTDKKLSLPDSKQIDKKRKKSKSPNPPKQNEKTKLTEEIQQIEQQEADSTKKIFDIKAENVSSILPEESNLLLKDSVKLEQVPAIVNIDDSNVVKAKNEKKKKKSPKIPVQTQNVEIEEIIQPKTSLVTESSEIKSETIPEVAAPTIEIESIKVAESTPSCDITPDVQFLRSSSYQSLDNNNNNTVIHEITNVEETKNIECTGTTVVECSGESLSQTPEIMASDMNIIKSKTAEKEEPTYLKSKIMEVNQDMEGLRLSIERSLAEFSAMEKGEEKAEKEYEAHRVECEKTFANIEITKPVEHLPKPVNVISEMEQNTTEEPIKTNVPPVCPARKDNKGKSKSKKKGKQDTTSVVIPSATEQSSTTTTTTSSDNKTKQEKQEKSEQKTETTESKEKQQSEPQKGKQQSDNVSDTRDDIDKIQPDSLDVSISEQTFSDSLEQLDFTPIDNFEDALTSSVDDVNKSFEIIVDENKKESQRLLAENKPDINVTAPADDTGNDKTKDDKVNPVSQPKNLLGHNDIPAQSNRIDYKKEKNKTPNERQAKVKIKDSSDVEAKKESKESQTETKRIRKPIEKSEKETYSRVKNDNEEYVYKYSFRKVFLQNSCHVCHKELVKVRVPCSYCHLVFYCGNKHKDDDWTQHQGLCFAVSTLAHLKDQKHIYEDSRKITGQEYRLLRMQSIVSCEKVLKRRLVPWEQEALLYPRLCADVACREWRQSKLADCEGCGQISYCSHNPYHLPTSHQRWCKSYQLYARLVRYQQTRGRLEPLLPTRVLQGQGALKGNVNEVLAAMYEEKIDMNDIEYAALTQLATAPLTAAYCYQLYVNKMDRSYDDNKRSSFTIHVVGAELQFEADALNKWELFFLHVRPDVRHLRVVLVSPALNPGDLPLDLLANIRLCDNCRQSRRRVTFSFQDKVLYSDYRSSDDFVFPDLVCAFNPSIHRSSVFSGNDPWPSTIAAILSQKIPFLISGHSLPELRKDVARVCGHFRLVVEPTANSFASVRPDRNFISDDEMPLLFKNYCVAVLLGY